MRGMTGLRAAMAAVGLLVGVSLAPAAAQAPASSMLQALNHGAWELNYRGGDGRGRICANSGRELIQIRHRAANCKHVVVEDKPDAVTVQYSCPRDGYGRTSIRRETGDLVQVDSQGIENGMPFHLKAEARRVDKCRGGGA
jgi:hypothetical protein